MATDIGNVRISGLPPLNADRILGVASLAMLAIVLAAIARGRAHWGEVPIAIWLHLALLLPALALTPIILAGRKGDRPHRALGYAWVALLLGVALESFLIPLGGRRFSPIWLISAFVLVQVPRLVLAARRHDMRRHRRIARGIAIGAFLVAGLFTLPFGRLLGRWLF